MFAKVWQKIRGLCNRGLVALGVVSAASVASAQESGGNLNVDLSAAESAVSSMASSVSGFLSGDLLDAILTIIGAGFVLFVVFLGIRYIKKGANRAGA